MNFVCVGQKGKNFVHIELESLKPLFDNELLDISFNSKKFLDFQKYSRIVLTVVGVVFTEYERELGFVVANNKGDIKLYKEEKLLSLLKKYPCMNYSIVEKDSKCYIRKNPKAVIRSYLDEDIKKLLGVSFEDFELKSEMTLEELDYCMQNNDFKLGYKEEFIDKSFGRERKAVHLVYFNSEGTQCVFNWVGNQLNYYHQDYCMMRHIDHNKYVNFIRNNPYSLGSTIPVDGVATDILVLTSQNIYQFLNSAKNAKVYSKPCKPYYISDTLDGMLEMVHITPEDSNIISEYSQEKSSKKGVASIDIRIFATYYIGYKKILKYNPELQKFYKNYISDFMKCYTNKAAVWKIDTKLVKSVIKDLDKIYSF